jgi:hypothetical protein
VTQGLSSGEAAKLAGVTAPAIRAAAKSGRLKQLPDGYYDPEDIEAWATSRRAPRGGRPPKLVEPSELATDLDATVVEAFVSENAGTFKDRAAAELHRDTYVALIRELEYRLKSGALVPIDAVAAEVGSEYARVRTRLLAIPAESAPRLFDCKTVTELQDVLLTLVTRVLEELTVDEREPSHQTV